MSIDLSRLRITFASLLVMSLSACATPAQTTSYYTLMPDVSPDAVPTDASYQIEVLPVDVPSQVDVPQMVVRTGNGELVPVDTRRWIAPLSNELRGALSWQLSHQLGVRDVSGFGKTAATPTYRISMRVQRFDSAPGAYARIDALWSARLSNNDSAALVCSSSANVTVGSGYAALAEGHQKALAQIAGEIAASIRATRAIGQSTCAAKTS